MCVCDYSGACNHQGNTVANMPKKKSRSEWLRGKDHFWLLEWSYQSNEPVSKLSKLLTSGAVSVSGLLSSLHCPALPSIYQHLTFWARNVLWCTLYLYKFLQLGTTLQPTVTGSVSESFLSSTVFSSLRLRMELIVMVVLHVFMGRWHKRHLAEQIQSRIETSCVHKCTKWNKILKQGLDWNCMKNGTSSTIFYYLLLSSTIFYYLLLSSTIFYCLHQLLMAALLLVSLGARTMQTNAKAGCTCERLQETLLQKGNPLGIPLESEVISLWMVSSSPGLWWGLTKRLDQLQTRRDSSTSLQPQAVKGHQLCTQLCTDDRWWCDELWCKCARSSRSECPSNLRRAATMVPASTRVNLVSITSLAYTKLKPWVKPWESCKGDSQRNLQRRTQVITG